MARPEIPDGHRPVAADVVNVVPKPDVAFRVQCR